MVRDAAAVAAARSRVAGFRDPGAAVRGPNRESHDVTRATVLILTHEHVETLRHAVASVQLQTLQDFELLIVGDGVADATRAVVAELSAADSRIRFFDFAKGPRMGESHRHQALQRAQGRFVAY